MKRQEWHRNLRPLIASLVLVAGCAPANTAPASPPTPVATPAGTPVRQATIALNGEPGGGSLPFVTFGKWPSTGVYENLVKADENLQVVPELATSWSFRGNNTWRFTLRQGVKFHDGKPFNATAVKESLDRVAGWKSFNTLGLNKDSVTVVDDFTVDVYSKISLRVPEVLSHRFYGIESPGYTDEQLDTQTPVGTGPFKFESYTRGQQYVVVRNPDYWGTKPELEKITFKPIPDANTRILALQAGQIDIAFYLTPAQAAQLLDTQGVSVVKASTGQYRQFALNTSGTPPYDLLKDKNLRRAVELSIDRQIIVDEFFGGKNGFAVLNNTATPAVVLGPAASKIKGPTYDTAAATRLLEEAGWIAGSDGIRAKDGRKLSLLIQVDPTDGPAVPQALQAMLKAVGIDSTLDVVPDSTAADARLEAGRGDIWSDRGSMTIPDPCAFCYLYVTPGHSGGAINYNKALSVGPKYDEANDKALAATTPADVQNWAAEAMRIAIDDEYVLIPIAALPALYAVRAGVQGLTPHPSPWNNEWMKIRIIR